MEISKRDWKLFREYVPKWQTRYIGKLERIRKDKKHPGVSIEISKGDAVYDLVLLCRTGVIDMSDLEEFSDSTRDAVRQLLDLR